MREATLEAARGQRHRGLRGERSSRRLLPEHARLSIARIAGKYFGRLNAPRVHFSRDGIAYRCTVTGQIGCLARKSAEAADMDIYAALEVAREKIAK